MTKTAETGADMCFDASPPPPPLSFSGMFFDGNHTYMIEPGGEDSSNVSTPQNLHGNVRMHFVGASGRWLLSRGCFQFVPPPSFHVQLPLVSRVSRPRSENLSEQWSPSFVPPRRIHTPQSDELRYIFIHANQHPPICINQLINFFIIWSFPSLIKQLRLFQFSYWKVLYLLWWSYNKTNTLFFTVHLI